MNRSPYGSGSVYRRGDGRWVAQIRDKAIGKTVQRTARTERDARRILREMTSRMDSGRLAVDRSATFAQWAEDWLSNRAERTRTGGTVAEYERNLRSYVLPLIGGKLIGSITVLDVERVLDVAFQQRDLSSSSLDNIKKSVSVVLSDAVRARALSHNVARGAQKPVGAAPAKRAVMPTAEQVVALLRAAEGTEVGRALVVLATSGARIGELLGTRWGDVDLETGAWAIERTVSRDRQNKPVIGSRTKGGNTRVLYLPQPAVDALREQRRAVLVRRLSATSWEEEDLIFPSRVGTAIDPSNFRKQLDKIRRSVNRRADDPDDPSTVRWDAGAFHALRHYFASVGLSNTEAAQVQQLLGHKTLRMTTSVYGHVTENVQRHVPEFVASTLVGGGS
jgi:integrase